MRVSAAGQPLSPRLFHVRDANGRHEVDILIEFGDGRVVGIEVKADSAPGPDAARHLHWLRDAVGSQFLLGAVFAHPAAHQAQRDAARTHDHLPAIVATQPVDLATG
jgi:hypothetical protein